jgi:hypothetical protein
VSSFCDVEMQPIGQPHADPARPAAAAAELVSVSAWSPPLAAMSPWSPSCSPAQPGALLSESSPSFGPAPPRRSLPPSPCESPLYASPVRGSSGGDRDRRSGSGASLLVEEMSAVAAVARLADDLARLSGSCPAAPAACSAGDSEYGSDGGSDCRSEGADEEMEPAHLQLALLPRGGAPAVSGVGGRAGAAPSPASPASAGGPAAAATAAAAAAAEWQLEQCLRRLPTALQEKLVEHLVSRLIAAILPAFNAPAAAPTIVGGGATGGGTTGGAATGGGSWAPHARGAEPERNERDSGVAAAVMRRPGGAAAYDTVAVGDREVACQMSPAAALVPSAASSSGSASMLSIGALRFLCRSCCGSDCRSSCSDQALFHRLLFHHSCSNPAADVATVATAAVATA